MKASIIVTSYNYSKYIERCLRSCLSQKFPRDEYEVIVIDDASSDGTHEILKKFSHFENFRYIINDENLGVAGASNVGVSSCYGQYFVRVDADDYINEYLLFFLTTYLELNHTAACVSCDYILVDDFGEKEERKYAAQDPVSCGILYRTDLITKYGLYNEEFRHREEEELRSRLAGKYGIEHLQIPLYRYRKHTDNKTSNLKEMELFKQRLESEK